MLRVNKSSNLVERQFKVGEIVTARVDGASLILRVVGIDAHVVSAKALFDGFSPCSRKNSNDLNFGIIHMDSLRFRHLTKVEFFNFSHLALDSFKNYLRIIEDSSEQDKYQGYIRENIAYYCESLFMLRYIKMQLDNF